MNGTVVLPLHEYSLPYQKTAGCLLREARQLKGLSQESVASSLNLMVSHVVAMESDAYNPHIEGKHFAAYLKSYARLVELNPQILLGLYQGQSDQPTYNYVLEQPATRQRSQGNGMSLRVITVLALLGLALSFTRQGIDVQQLPEKSRQWMAQVIQSTLAEKPSYFPSPGESAESGAPQSVSDGAWRELEAAPDAEALLAESTAALSSESEATEQATLDRLKQPQSASPAKASAVQEQESNIVVTPSDATYQAYRLDVLDDALIDGAVQQDVLQFTFAGNCWIEVYDSNQNPIVMETKLEGELLRISGEAPFEVRVGNSRAVSLLLNGEPVHIEQHPTIDSTELIVGRR